MQILMFAQRTIRLVNSEIIMVIPAEDMLSESSITWFLGNSLVDQFSTMSITLLILGGRILQSLLISMASQAGRMVEMELSLKE
jgi:hypothetical protein